MKDKFIKLLFKNLDTNSPDIPVSAIITKGDEVISSAQNEREKNNKVIHHAEILAIERANEVLGSWRLNECDMYVTLEPCPMCAWAIINSGIKNLYFCSYDTKYGAFGSAINLKTLANSKINVVGGIEEERANKILEEYFRKLR